MIREARLLTDCSQAELADRADTSQSRVSRIELGQVEALDLAVACRLLRAVGVRGSLVLDDLALEDRRAQADTVHAWIVAVAARRLRVAGWQTATEVPIGGTPPRGWIDLIAYRPSDRAGLVSEVKGDLPDIGGMQRQVTFYEHAAAHAMAERGWRPAAIATLVLALDSLPVHAALRTSASALASSFPGSPGTMHAWLAGTGNPVPPRTLALVDPASKRAQWLLRSPLTGRRSGPAYAGYGEAAASIGAQRRRGPRSPPGAVPRCPQALRRSGAQALRRSGAQALRRRRPHGGPPRTPRSSSRSRAP